MNRPEWSSRPQWTNSATASTSPDPQIPTGSTSPITSRVSVPSEAEILTPSIAPSEARIPHLIWAASNAGPAGAAVATTRSTEPSAISLLVPTSMNNLTRRSRVRPVASIPATMSPPT